MTLSSFKGVGVVEECTTFEEVACVEILVVQRSKL